MGSKEKIKSAGFPPYRKFSKRSVLFLQFFLVFCSSFLVGHWWLMADFVMDFTFWKGIRKSYDGLCTLMEGKKGWSAGPDMIPDLGIYGLTNGMSYVGTILCN